MSFRLLIRKLPLLLMLLALISGLTVSGCAQTGAIPRGWSGGTVTDNALFLGSMGGKLVAIDISSRTRLWPDVPFEIAKPTGGFGCAPRATVVAIYGTPAMAGDLVYTTGYNGKIYAINSKSGALRWVYPREGNLQPIIGGPATALNKVYIGGSDGKVYALDAADGYEEWEKPFETGNKIWSTPAIDGDTLFIGSFDKKLYALNAADGSKKWEFEAEGAIAATPVVYNNTVYIGSFDRHLYAVNITNGKQIWKFPANEEDKNKPGKWFWATPVIYGNTIYAASLDGKVYILDAGSGHERVDPIDLESPVSSSPVMVGGSIIVATEEGVVYTLDTKDNQQRRLANLEEKIYAPLSASNGVVYIHTEKDVIYAVDAQSGVTLWRLSLKS